MDYREHLLWCSYMYLWNEWLDVFIKSFKSPTSFFDINHYVSFNNSITCTIDHLHHTNCHTLARPYTYNQSNLSSHFYYYRLPYLWNSLTQIDITLPSSTIKKIVTEFLWNYFIANFDPTSPCTYAFHFYCPCCNCSKTPHSPTYTPISFSHSLLFNYVVFR